MEILLLQVQSLHDVKGLLKSISYLSNPNSATATEASAQADILAGINDIVSGGLITEAANAASTTEVFLESTNNNQIILPLLRKNQRVNHQLH
jgi:hypothetical protein